MKNFINNFSFLALVFTACDSKGPITSNAVSKSKINEEKPKFESQTYSLITTDESWFQKYGRGIGF